MTRDTLPQVAQQGTEDFTPVHRREKLLCHSSIYHYLKGTSLIKGGPYLNLIGAVVSDWSLKQIEVKTQASEVVVDIVGVYSAQREPVNTRRRQGDDAPSPPLAGKPTMLEVHFEVRIDGGGGIVTNYTLDKLDLDPPATRVVPWNNTNAGGYQEVGITYLLSGRIDRLAWQRDGLWSVYPEDHIARNHGIAVRRGSMSKVNEKPTWTYAMEETSPGIGTNDFRSQKENIRFASAIISDAKLGIRVESEGNDAVRLEAADPLQADSDLFLHINNQWNYRNLGLGNYTKPPVVVRSGYSNSVKLRLVEDAR